MYQEATKLQGKKLIEICILLFLILWGIILLVNYRRYCDSKKPFLMIHSHIEYDDGYTDNYIGLFYNIRYYRRNSIAKDEMVPFWVFMENPEPTPDLPVPEKGYNVPENPKRLDKYRGLLYYFDDNRELIGTYKCINTTTGCDKAKSGWDSYNVIGNNPFTESKVYYNLDVLYGKYAFVDDSFEQTPEYGDSTYSRIIYLYKIDKDEPEILAKYSDIKESTSDSEHEIANGFNYNYIVKSMDNDKWGVIHISEAGTIEEVVPFEYDSVTYDQDTYLYILCKDGLWSIKDFTKDEIIAENIATPIYDVWRNNNMSYYYITGTTKNVGGVDMVYFKAYRSNGTPFIDIDGVTGIFPFYKCAMYVDSSDNKLKFIDYGREVRFTLQLNFSTMKHDTITHPAVEIMSYDEYRARVKIYNSHDKSNEFETESINIDDLTRN